MMLGYHQGILLFESIGRFFCYSPNSGIVELEENIFHRLQHGQDLSEEENLLHKLRIKAVDVPVLMHPETDNVRDILDRQLKTITLQITQECNLRCAYCIYSEEKNTLQRTHSRKVMDVDTARRALDFLWEHSIDSRHIHIGFYGGEPLLAFECLKQSVLYAEKLFEGKRISFSLTTNGVLLSEDRADFLYRHHFSLTISIDGGSEYHDYHRKTFSGSGSYEAIANNLSVIANRYCDWLSRIRIHTVIDPARGYEGINKLWEDSRIPGVLKNTWSVAFLSGAFDKEKPQVSAEYYRESNYQVFLGVLAELKRVKTESLSPIGSVMWERMKNEFTRVSSISRCFETDVPSGPCIPGNSRLLCSVDGILYPCERISELSASAMIGDLKNGFELEKVQALLNVSTMNHGQCGSCWCFKLCGLCGRAFMDERGRLSDEVKRVECESIQRQYESQLKNAVIYQTLLGKDRR